MRWVLPFTSQKLVMLIRNPSLFSFAVWQQNKLRCVFHSFCCRCCCCGSKKKVTLAKNSEGNIEPIPMEWHAKDRTYAAASCTRLGESERNGKPIESEQTANKPLGSFYIAKFACVYQMRNQTINWAVITLLRGRSRRRSSLMAKHSSSQARENSNRVQWKNKKIEANK